MSKTVKPSTSELVEYLTSRKYGPNTGLNYIRYNLGIYHPKWVISDNEIRDALKDITYSDTGDSCDKCGQNQYEHTNGTSYGPRTCCGYDDPDLDAWEKFADRW